VSDTAIFWIGAFVSSLCVAFMALSAIELRRLGEQSEKRRGEWSPRK
jgi:hypothetical protein